MVIKLLEIMKGKALKLEHAEMLMMHFFGTPSWASCATDEGFGQSRSTSKESFRNPIRHMKLEQHIKLLSTPSSRPACVAKSRNLI
jgi:hypothetical protein